jgi:hypothetical protein
MERARVESILRAWTDSFVSTGTSGLPTRTSSTRGVSARRWPSPRLRPSPPPFARTAEPPGDCRAGWDGPTDQFPVRQACRLAPRLAGVGGGVTGPRPRFRLVEDGQATIGGLLGRIGRPEKPDSAVATRRATLAVGRHRRPNRQFGAARCPKSPAMVGWPTPAPRAAGGLRDEPAPTPVSVR